MDNHNIPPRRYINRFRFGTFSEVQIYEFPQDLPSNGEFTGWNVVTLWMNPQPVTIQVHFGFSQSKDIKDGMPADTPHVNTFTVSGLSDVNKQAVRNILLCGGIEQVFKLLKGYIDFATEQADDLSQANQGRNVRNPEGIDHVTNNWDIILTMLRMNVLPFAIKHDDQQEPTKSALILKEIASNMDKEIDMVSAFLDAYRLIIWVEEKDGQPTLKDEIVTEVEKLRERAGESSEWSITTGAGDIEMDVYAHNQIMADILGRLRKMLDTDLSDGVTEMTDDGFALHLPGKPDDLYEAKKADA